MPKWRRMGLVVSPPAQHAIRADGAPTLHPWWKSHAGMPTCMPLHDRLWRIWFGGRDAARRARVLCADVDPGDGMKVLSIRPVAGLEHGREDEFDGAGLWPSSAVAWDGRILLWYTGMRLERAVPYVLSIGLAVSEDQGLTFRKVGGGPVLSAAAEGSRFVTTPCVRRCPGGFEMWYSSGREWRQAGGNLDPWYDIRHASSADGLVWTPRAQPVLSLEDTDWAGLTRPWVDDATGRPVLWFSARGADRFREATGAAYRIYSAPLRGGLVHPHEIAPVRFTPSPGQGDWDGWMQTCCSVLSYRGNRVMFYHGNDFAATGFGYALEQPVEQVA